MFFSLKKMIILDCELRISDAETLEEFSKLDIFKARKTTIDSNCELDMLFSIFKLKLKCLSTLKLT